MKMKIPLVILILIIISGCSLMMDHSRTPTAAHLGTATLTSTDPGTDDGQSASKVTETTAPVKTISPTTTITPPTEFSPTSTLDPSVLIPEISEIHMTSKTLGWAVASIEDSVLVLRTSDGGISWIDVTPPIESWSASIEPNEFCDPQLGDGYFMDEQRAWLSTLCIDKERPQDSFTSEAMLITTDGGSSWHVSILPPGGFGFSLGRFIHFTDPSKGWFILYGHPGGSAGYRRLYQTRDGGESWEMIYVTQGAPSGSYDSSDLAFGDPTTGLFTVNRIGWGGPLYTIWTQDGGKTWESHSLPEPEDPSVSDPSILEFDCGSDFPHAFSKHEVSLLVECRILKATDTDSNKYFYNNFIYSTRDGGISWHSYPAPIGSLQLISPSTGWIFGSEIHFTDNGGMTWTNVNEVPWEGQFSFVDADHGWAVARHDDKVELLITDDGGRSWMILEPELIPEA